GPVFSGNGTNAAKNTTVTFNRAGNYLFQVTITDAGGLSTTSSVVVSVNQTLSSIAVTPAAVILRPGAKQLFLATAFDQSGQALASQPFFLWRKLSGIGKVNASGVFTAPQRTGKAVISASVGNVSGTALITVSNSGAASAARIRSRKAKSLTAGLVQPLGPTPNPPYDPPSDP